MGGSGDKTITIIISMCTCKHYIDNNNYYCSWTPPLYSPSRNLQLAASSSLSERLLLTSREIQWMEGVAREVRGWPSVEGEGGGHSKRGERRPRRSSEKPSSISCSWREQSVDKRRWFSWASVSTAFSTVLHSGTHTYMYMYMYSHMHSV